MMDKKLIEKYLKYYPHLDGKIKSIENDLKYYENKKTEYNMRNRHNNRNDILKNIEDGLKEKHAVLSRYVNAEIFISNVLDNADSRCKKIIELHFWEKRKWEEVGEEIGISGRHAKRLYKKFINTINVPFCPVDNKLDM